MASTIELPSTPSSIEDEELHAYEIVARLIIYSAPVSEPTHQKKSKVKPKKETKSKEFKYIFAKTKANYVDLLQTILEKHHVNDSVGKVTERKVYPCKVQVPPTAQKDASDIVDYEEYEALVSKIFQKKPTKPIVIVIEMSAVEKILKKKNSNANPDSEGSDGETEDLSLCGLSKVDYELARLRGLLEKKYANDHDSGYTYIDPVTSTLIPLTPFMMKEWTRAMYDGIATINVPPPTATFDVANRQSSIGLTRNRAQSSSSGTEPEVSTLSAVSTLISSLTGLVRGPGFNRDADAISTPKKRVRDTDDSDDIGMIYNTPSKLRRFLEEAENVGISFATRYSRSLSDQQIGPDILHLVENKELAGLGIPYGDIIRLKEFAPRWWKAEPKRTAKHRRTGEARMESTVNNSETPPNKKYRFEKKYNDGGSMTVFGPGWDAGDVGEDADYIWHVYSKDLKMTVPLPRGVVPIIDGEDNNDNLNWNGF